MPSTGPESTETRVVLGVLESAPDTYWLERRPDDKHLAGLLAFPGGKCGADESPLAALRRELIEELGIEAETIEPLIEIPWVYAASRPPKHVRLLVYRVFSWRGPIRGREGQSVEPVRLDCRDRCTWLDALPPANRGIVAALCLPPRVAISAACGSDAQGFERWLADLCATAAELARRFGAAGSILQLRPGMELSLEEWRRAAAAVRAQGVCVFVNGALDLADALNADGVHLNRQRLFDTDVAALAAWQARGRWVTAAVHADRELHRANELRADAVFISPVLPTESHPGEPAMGWDGFAALTRAATMPTYALGGMSMGALSRVRALGGQGVAAIRAFWCRGADEVEAGEESDSFSC
ncbi:hypothetical protein A9404_11090 [Halothiobacillus diazotrophicus]|uniref:8-oxo-dGTP diphosphatase n=1 Tax=Halothiobacillus diazotrophicus TaxID=1860122 RepID=A0A191ZIX9_9GAMM|nr:thiamine phosphate synthase [Halothiobacillus diazotrophicus]ANJ67851.1 hypothetical protein A9404_11090 [Halothiobacillus diazotrophicus]